MIFIGGVQPKTVRVEKSARACPSCAHFDVYLQRVDHYISLFFIPLLPIKKGVPFLVCDHCGALLDQNSFFAGKTAEKPRQCGFCGRTVETDFSYCPSCGRALES